MDLDSETKHFRFLSAPKRKILRSQRNTAKSPNRVYFSDCLKFMWECQRDQSIDLIYFVQSFNSQASPRHLNKGVPRGSRSMMPSGEKSDCWLTVHSQDSGLPGHVRQTSQVAGSRETGQNLIWTIRGERLSPVAIKRYVV